jgi:hypothetical protein
VDRPRGGATSPQIGRNPRGLRWSKPAVRGLNHSIQGLVLAMEPVPTTVQPGSSEVSSKIFENLEILIYIVVFSDLYEQNSKLSSLDLLECPEADIKIIQDSLSELYEFARANVLELSKMEKRTTGSKSSIDTFCRIDIGLIQIENGSLQYFVNEVERGLNVSLWTGQQWPYLMGEVAAKLGPLLHSWVGENL